MSKTERALEDSALLDAPDDGSSVDAASQDAGGPASDDAPDGNGSLPAPTVAGFAPPTAPDSTTEPNGNGHRDDAGSEAAGDTLVDEVHETAPADDVGPVDEIDDITDLDHTDDVDEIDDIAVEQTVGTTAETDGDDVDATAEPDTDADLGSSVEHDTAADGPRADVHTVDGSSADAGTIDVQTADEALGGASEPLDPDLARSIEGLFDDEPPDDTPVPLPAPAVGVRSDLASDIAADESGSPDGDADDAVDEATDDSAAAAVAAGGVSLFTEPPTVDDPDGAEPAVDEPPAEGPLAEEAPADGAPVEEPPAVVAIPGEALRVSPPGADVLEELRTSKVDGPTVEVAPQDDDTGYNVRRPHRLREYDPAPIPIPAKVPRLLGRKPRVRKVTRVVRHVDPWSVFKIAIIANLVLYVILLVAGVLLWNVANATGTVDNVERFFESFGWSSFEFNGGEIYHAAWVAGLFLVVGFTGAAVLLATLFNLITDLVGGMRFTVLEEEVVETRTSPMRRFVVRRPEPEVPAVERDDSGTIVREAVVDDSGAIVRRTR